MDLVELQATALGCVVAGRKLGDKVPARRFKGGVKPFGHKEATRDLATVDAPLPPEVIIPLLQSAGTPCEPLVKKGDRVLGGQMIGRSEAFVSAPIHASVSGTIVAIEQAPHFSGSASMSIRISSDADQKETEFAPVSPDAPADEISPDDIRGAVREAGIVGMGGAAFPTYVKLSPPKDKPIDTVIINGCECEPYLTADYRNIIERADKLVDGALLIARTVGAGRIVVAVEDDTGEAEKSLRGAIDASGGLPSRPSASGDGGAAAGTPVDVVILPAAYPQGSEKHLIRSVLGREVPAGGLPFDVGAYVQNVGTTIAVSEAVREGRPLIERVMTVAGAVKEPKNVRVKIGTPVRTLVEQCCGFEGHPGMVLLGGPMMGVSLFNLDVPVVKGSSGVVVISREECRETAGRSLGTCIRCGRCVKVCPMGLLPGSIGNFAKAEMWDQAGSHHVLDCIECGCCAYNCPARVPLVQLNRLAKATLYGRGDRR